MVLGSSEVDQPPWKATALRIADSKLRGSVRTRREYYVACSPEQQSVDSFLSTMSDKTNEVFYVYYISYDLCT